MTQMQGTYRECPEFTAANELTLEKLREVAESFFVDQGKVVREIWLIDRPDLHWKWWHASTLCVEPPDPVSAILGPHEARPIFTQEVRIPLYNVLTTSPWEGPPPPVPLRPPAAYVVMMDGFVNRIA